MKKTLIIALLSFIFILICKDVMAIELIRTGPYGKPILVMDAAGNYSIPIKVYSDSERDIFIPNITTFGWVQWNKEEFFKRGTYRTVIYDHFKKDSFCRREMIPDNPDRFKLCSKLRYRRRHVLVDTRKNTVTFLEEIYIKSDARWYPESVAKFNLTLNNAQLSKTMRLTIARITAIVTNEARAAADTPSAQDDMRYGREITVRMSIAGRSSNEGKSTIEINCELDCYLGSEYYDGLHLYDAAACKRKCPPQSREEVQKREEVKKDIEDCNKAISLNRKDVEAYIKRGKAYAKLGFTQELSDMETATRLGSEEARDYLKKRGIIVK